MGMPGINSSTVSGSPLILVLPLTLAHEITFNIKWSKHGPWINSFSLEKANILHLHLKMHKYLFLLHENMKLYDYEWGNYAQTAMYIYRYR